MVFVLLTYGGWNEAAYVSAELRRPRRMAAALVLSIVLITGLYILVNLAYLRALGMAAMSQSQAVTADAVRVIAGEGGALTVAGVIIAAVVTSLNVTIMTGARSGYALARDFPGFSFLGRWHANANAPVSALIVQGALALVLVLCGTLGRSGFETMVQYVSPVFWLFFMLTGISLFVLRRRAPRMESFRVPLYPLTPFLFIAACAYMFYASIAYAGTGALFGMLVLAAGIPLFYIARPRAALAKVSSED
jgi:amino acid transporter